MFKFYRALKYRENEVNDHEIQALIENSIFFRKREYFHNTKIGFFFSLNVNKFQYFKVYFEKVSAKSAGYKLL